MDSLTHGLVGASIAFVAMKIEVFDSTFYLFTVSIIASLIPDIDVLTRLISKNTYLRNHRGLTHNVFMWFVYAIIASLFAIIYQESIIYSVILVFVCVAIHVLLDSLNSYGVKMTPNSRWVRVGLLNTVDVFLIIILSIFILVNALSYEAYTLYIFMVILLIYLIIRFFIFLSIKRYIKKSYDDFISYSIFSAVNAFKYEAIIEYEDEYLIIDFYIRSKRIIVKKKFETPEVYLDVIKDTNSYHTFIDFSPYYYQRMYDYGSDLVKIKFTDLRYHKKNGYFYFNAIFIIEKETLKITKEYLSFSISRKKIEKNYWI